MEMITLEVNLTNIRDDLWYVSLPNLGSPDFYIHAESKHAALDTLEGVIHDALDHKEDVYNDD